MTAHSETTVTINHSAQKVHQALSTKEYWEFIAEKLSPEPGQLHDFTGDTATLFEVLPKSILPEAAQAMISQDLKLKRVVTIGALDGDKATLSYTGDVKGTPVDFSGDIALSGEGDVTSLAYDNEAKVNIPFMGAALEPKVGEALEEIFANEAKLTEQWISENL
ncbi:hypothetical protein CAPI_00925 [Corynebacterium capitovis DSM 44611]|uniref:DUF2505 domain-containing protein n=1 Tax=Corynebacterium capitovis TaxID=131081 RepID=UPI0003793068|nr:DUF2505 domain-containing protein [Corynebacterium capitovis]WKD56763.1 hypothetical protein CAPI_00925 [Corynebacterium capitovis DSM 44611]